MINNLLFITNILYKYIKWKLPLVLLFSLITAGFEIVSLVLLAPLLEALLKSKEVINLSDNNFSYILSRVLRLDSQVPVNIILIVFIISIAIKTFTTFFTFSLIASSISSITISIRAQMLQSISSIKFSRFTQLNFGEFANLFNEQANIAGQGYNNTFLVYNKLISSTIYFISVLLISWSSPVVVAIFSIPTIFLFRITSKKISYYSHRSVEYSSKTQSNIINYGKSYKYLKSINKLGEIEDNLKSLTYMTELFKRKSYTIKGLTVSLRDPISISILLVTVIAAANLNIGETTYLALIIVAYKLLQSINNLQQNIQNLNIYIGPIKKINNFLAAYSVQAECTGALLKVDDIFTIEFQNVSLDLNHTRVLKNINLNFKSGNKYGIIGKSGSGKSTLIDLITMLYTPTCGSILIDGIKAQTIDPMSWRKNIGFVPQAPYLYNSSIVENLYYGFDSLKQNEKIDIFEAIKLSTIQTGIYDFIMSTPNKFDSIVGEGGLQLSGGQAQRIALARELIRKPKILILDEATSALDPESEKYVHSTIASLNSSVTVFVISHKLSTLVYCDKIVIVNSGEVKEIMSYNDLISDEELVKKYS